MIIINGPKIFNIDGISGVVPIIFVPHCKSTLFRNVAFNIDIALCYLIGIYLPLVVPTIKGVISVPSCLKVSIVNYLNKLATQVPFCFISGTACFFN